MSCVLGIDIGGTSIKAGLFTPEGKLVEVKKIPTGAIDDEKAFAERLAASFRSHCLSTSASARILPCSLGNEAGMYGVAYAALQEAAKGV